MHKVLVPGFHPPTLRRGREGKGMKGKGRQKEGRKRGREGGKA
jgi:hypothetical protein